MIGDMGTVPGSSIGAGSGYFLQKSRRRSLSSLPPETVMSLSTLAIPRVPLQKLDEKRLSSLQAIWTVANTNEHALEEFHTAFKEGRVTLDGSGLESQDHRTLFNAIRTLQPPGMHAIDEYTIVLVKGLWNLAIVAPECLQQKVRGVPPYNEALSALEWSIWKLGNNHVARARSVNSVPISALASETLALIFQELQQASPSFPSSHAEITSHLIVRLVCKRFRFIIDITPEVWADMNLGFGVPWTKRSLTLSRNVSIDVQAFATAFHHSHSASALLCLSELHRIRDLGFRCPWSLLQLVTVLLTSCEAPRLQSLLLKPIDHNGSGDYRIGRLSTQIFRGRTPPRLQTIVLEDHIISPDCPIFLSPLVCIDLTCCRVWSDLSSFIDSLNALPTLEVLRWAMPGNILTSIRSTNMVFPHTEFMSAGNRVTSLPRLRELSLEWPTACFAALMAHISIPPTCVIHLHDDYAFTGDELHDDIALRAVCDHLDAGMGQHLARSQDSAAGGGFDTLNILECAETEPGHGAIVIEGQRSSTSRRSSSTSPQRFSITFTVSNALDEGKLREETLRSLLGRILAWSALKGSITKVLTNHEAMASEGMWTTVLNALSRISCVEIENSSDSDASDALDGLAGAMGQRQNLVPELCDIALSHIALGPAVQQRLATVIELRQRMGYTGLRFTLAFRGQNDSLVTLKEAIARHGGKIEVLQPYEEIFS